MNFYRSSRREAQDTLTDLAMWHDIAAHLNGDETTAILAAANIDDRAARDILDIWADNDDEAVVTEVDGVRSYFEGSDLDNPIAIITGMD
ncbi:hypothetical protein ACTXN7_11655 [Corynebacterium flavescens]|uniref:hypothetical protein n=1 Tax=Corynebacterium flavescens TaxID=28028 RepID=UPI003FD58E49